jgi:hypothetical protein
MKEEEERIVLGRRRIARRQEYPNLDFTGYQIGAQGERDEL